MNIVAASLVFWTEGSLISVVDLFFRAELQSAHNKIVSLESKINKLEEEVWDTNFYPLAYYDSVLTI